MTASNRQTTSALLSKERYAFLDTQGYLILEDALAGDQLARVQEAFRRVEEETREEWQQALLHPPQFKPYGLGETAHVVEPIVTRGEIFLDLLEYPLTISTARAFVGPDIQMLDNALHVKPAGTKSHTRWHRDARTCFYAVEEWSAEDRREWERLRACEKPFFKLKVFFFVDDIDEDTAPFSVVPGTHALEVEQVPQYETLEDMPNHVKATGRAGTAIIWNASIWHTAMDHTGTKPRRMLLYNYAHFGMKQYAPCVPTPELAAHTQAGSPLCRQLLGLERMPRS